jgi:hypothetical protein
MIFLVSSQSTHRSPNYPFLNDLTVLNLFGLYESVALVVCDGPETGVMSSIECGLPGRTIKASGFRGSGHQGI